MNSQARTRLLITLMTACATLTPALRARADGADVTATALFDEGRKLMAAHRYAEACPKLAESERLAPSGGTLINLAECYEHMGQTASAWGAWKDVAARANAAGKPDVEQNANFRAAALEPSLAKLTITVPQNSDVPGLEVKRDGVVLGRAEFGLPIPVDPGIHVVEATAPHKKPSLSQVTVAAKQTDAHLTIALGEGEQPPATTVATAPEKPAVPSSFTSPGSSPPAAAGSTQRTLGWVGVGLGAAGLAAGSIFGLEAIAKNNQAVSGGGGCSGSTCSTGAGVSDTNAALSAATVSTVAFIAGGALAATGIVLLVTAPSGLQVTPAVGRSEGGIAVRGPW